MKTMHQMFTISLAAIFSIALFGCERTDEQVEDSPSQGAATQQNAMPPHINSEPVFEPFSDMRDDVVARFQEGRERVAGEIEELRSEAQERDLVGEVRTRFDAASERLDEAWQDFRDNLQRARAEGTESWSEIQAELRSAWDRTQQALQDARAALNSAQEQ